MTDKETRQNSNLSHVGDQSARHNSLIPGMAMIHVTHFFLEFTSAISSCTKWRPYATCASYNSHRKSMRSVLLLASPVLVFVRSNDVVLHVTVIEIFRTHIPTSHHHISVIRRVEFSLPLQSLQMLETSHENAVCPPSNMFAHTPGQNHLLHVSYTSDADTTRTSLHPSQFTHFLVCFLMGSTVKDHNSFAWCGWATSNVHGRNCFAKALVKGAQTHVSECILEE